MMMMAAAAKLYSTWKCDATGSLNLKKIGKPQNKTFFPTEKYILFCFFFHEGEALPMLDVKSLFRRGFPWESTNSTWALFWLSSHHLNDDVLSTKKLFLSWIRIALAFVLMQFSYYLRDASTIFPCMDFLMQDRETVVAIVLRIDNSKHINLLYCVRILSFRV